MSSKGSRSIKQPISRREQKSYSPSMKAPGDGKISKAVGNADVFGAERHASKFADAMAPYGGSAVEATTKSKR